MRHGTAGRRLRNRGSGGPGSGNGNNNHNTNTNNRSRGSHHGGGGGNRNQVFDSNGPDVRIRGTAHQIQEKYAILAKDAAASGDRIIAESYLQHAEHYQRVINSWNDQNDYAPSFPQEDEQDDFQDKRFGIRQPQQRQQQSAPQPSVDLGLPASITGEVQTIVRQPEMTEA